MKSMNNTTFSTPNIEFVDLTTPESLQIIRDLAADVWPKTFANILSPEQIAYMMKMMYAPEVMTKELSDGFLFAVLQLNGTPCGYMVFSPYPEPDSKEEAKLHKLYLLEAYQGRGLGQQMLQYVMHRCKTAGFQTLRLNVNKQNQKAIKAYLRAGFFHAESCVIDIGQNFVMDDYVMKIEL